MKRILLAAAVLMLAACDSVQPTYTGPGEQELITRVTLRLEHGSEVYTAAASDPDGDGAGFVIDELVLPADAFLEGTIEVADDINQELISDEVAEEADEHQFFYLPQGGVEGRMVVEFLDMDGNGLPVGLRFSVQVSPGLEATGILRVILSHYDDEPKDGVNRSGETDIDLSFPVRIQ
jgi:hypothetical protein